MSYSRLSERLTSFEKALAVLHEVAGEDIQSHAQRLGIVHAFNIVFELAWKCCQDYLQATNALTGSGPRAVLGDALTNGLLDNGEGWLAMLSDRNQGIHTYSGDLADDIADHVNQSYLVYLDQLLSTLKSRLP